MKKYLPFIPGILIGTLLSIGTIVYAATPVTQVVNGGTGSTTLSGILIGNGKSPVNTVIIGSNLSLTGTTLSATGGGTNFLSNVSANTFLNTGTNLQAPVLMATSTTATSTFAGDVAIGSTGLPNPYLFIGTSTAHLPLYGRIAGDLIDSELDWNGVSSINVANANQGSCAASTYFADGNNPTLGGYYGTFSFLNDGWTNGGGAGCFIGASNTDKPEAVVIASPTGEMDFDIASTTQTGAADFNWNVNNATKMKLTNAGNLGIGTTTGQTPLTISSSSQVTSGQTYLADLETAGASPTTAAIQFADYGLGFGEFSTLSNFFGVWQFYDATSTSENTTNTNILLALANSEAIFTTKGTNAFTVGPSGSTNPSFNLNNSITNSATGISITTAATGGTTALVTTDSGSNSSLTINAKGTGTIGIGTVSTGIITIGSGSTASIVLATPVGNAFVVNTASFTSRVNTLATAATVRWGFTGAADSTLTGATEAPSVYWNLGQIRSHSSGAITTQRDFRITPSTHTFTAGTSNANSTIVNSWGFSIDGPPGQGANVNYTNVVGLNIGAGGSYTTASTTNAIGLQIQAPAGATNNYAASTSGRVVMSSLGAGAGAGSLCQASTGEILFDSGANCIVSSLRFKNVDATITPEESLSTVMQLSPIFFHYKQGYGDGGTQQQEGFGAEEVALVDKDLVQYDAQEKPYSVFYQNITAKLVGAVQAVVNHQSEQDKEIAQLQSEVKQLQANQQSYLGCHI